VPHYDVRSTRRNIAAHHSRRPDALYACRPAVFAAGLAPDARRESPRLEGRPLRVL